MDGNPVLPLLVGVLALGFLLALAAWRRQQQRAQTVAQELAAKGTELALSMQRLEDKGRTMADAEQARERARAEIVELQDRLAREVEKRAVAEEKASRVAQLENRVEELQESNRALGAELSELRARMQEERKAAEEKLELVEEARAKLAEAFKALSFEALEANNASFLQLAKTQLEKFQESARSDLETRNKAINDLVKPVSEALEKVDGKLHDLEKNRVEAYAVLKQQVESMAQAQQALTTETAKLVQALRKPQVRGRWGEIQLRRVVELAGMVNYCDFVEQKSVETESGTLRPDLIVKLPGGRNLVVDAKAPLEAYLDALECRDEEERASRLRGHAQQIATHMRKLSAKGYMDQFQPSPDFVVMFLPGETFFSAALEQNPALIEQGVGQRVIPASPTTLIALLRAVAYGWRQEEMARSAQEVAALGKELYERLAVLASYFDGLGKHLGRAVDSYNKGVRSLETRVLVTVRKFSELGVSTSKDIVELAGVESSPLSLQAPESESVVSQTTEPCES